MSASISHVRADSNRLAAFDHDSPYTGFADRYNASRMAGMVAGTIPNARADAAAGLALARELEKVSAIVTEQKYPHLTSFEVFPPAPDQPDPWQESYLVKDLVGAGGRVSHSYMDKGTAADLIISLNTAIPVIPYISHAGYTLPEIARAALSNVALPAWKLQFVRRVIEEAQNTANWFGDASTGVVGFWDATGVTTPAVVANGALGSPLWADKLPDEMIADVTEMIVTHQAKVRAIPELTANMLALPPESYTRAATTFVSISNGSNITVLKAIEMFGESLAPGFRVVRAYELSTIPAGKTGAGSRGMTLFRSDGMVVGRVVAMPLSFLPPEVESLATTVVGHAQSGGLCVRYPVAIEQRYGL